MPRETWRRLDGSLGFAGNRVLQVPGFPLRLAGHAAGRVGQRFEPLVPDLATAVLADAVGALGLAVPGVLGLLTITLYDLLAGLVVRPLAPNLREIRFPHPFAPITQYPPP